MPNWQGRRPRCPRRRLRSCRCWRRSNEASKRTGPKAEAAPPHVDAYGDQLPAEAVARPGTLRLYHGQNVDRVVLSADAKLVVSFARNYNSGNRLWDAITGRELPLKEELKMTPVFTAKGKQLALEKRERNEL